MEACALVPLFEHGATLGPVLRGLAKHGLPLLVVDDGSGEATRAELERLRRELPELVVRTHARNRGKGAALRTGYREAARRGFTHALQIDADGQHDPCDAPRFLEAMRARPRALVLGAPVFDASVPRHRLWGRQLSRAMVWAATASLDVADPLCGFRGVPLAPALRVIDAVATGDRMDFEPELAVRLHWAGVPVVTLPVRVVYPEGGLSHFDVLWDDLRLAALYTRLLAQAPLRVARARLGSLR